MQRLAALESDGVLATNRRAHHFDAAQQATRRKHVLSACFGLGFASSVIAGGLVLLILPFVNPGDARVNAPWSFAQASAAPAPSWFGSPPAPSNDNRSSMAVLVSLSRDPESERRLLWWKLPMLDDN